MPTEQWLPIDGTPGCIIGQVIHNLKPGLNLETLEGYGAIGALDSIGIDVPFSTHAGQLAHLVQRHQDSGKTWTEALELAKTAVEKS